MSLIWNSYNLINRELDAVKNIISEEIERSPLFIKNALKEIVNSNAKFLRSGFFLLASKFGNIKNEERLLIFAAVIEMFHLATLIHDDVIDDTATRRSKPALHTKVGKRTAILTGDFLFLKCYNMIGKYVDFPLVEKLSLLGLRICTSEINQAGDLFNSKISVLRYLKRIAGKTASLFAFSFYLGALESGSSNEIQNLFSRSGFSFGISFQIIDDIFDFTKSVDIIGKNIHKDLEEGIYTLPVIYALKNDKGKLTALLENKFDNEERIKNIIKLVIENRGIEESAKLAEKYTTRALKFASCLPDVPVKKVLTEVIKELLTREY